MSDTDKHAVQIDMLQASINQLREMHGEARREAAEDRAEIKRDLAGLREHLTSVRLSQAKFAGIIAGAGTVGGGAGALLTKLLGGT